MRSVSNPDNLGTDSLIDTATPYAYVPYEYNVLFEWLLLLTILLRTAYSYRYYDKGARDLDDRPRVGTARVPRGR